MYRRLVLDALAQASPTGDDHRARQALAEADPLVRGWLRGRVARALAVASSSVADRTDRIHVVRLAFLQEARLAHDIDPEDKEGIRAAFEASSSTLGVGRRDRVWWASISLASAVVLVAIVSVWVTRPRFSFSPVSTPLGEALGPGLTAYVRSIHEYLQGRRSGATPPEDFSAPLDRVLAQASRELSPPKKEALANLLRTYQARALANHGTLATEEALGAALQRANASLHEADKPYLIDAIEHPSTGLYLTSSYVARERAVRAEGATIRLVRVQRLDSLNFALAVLGYTRPQLGAAVVTLDLLERDFVTLVAPALAPGGKARIVDLDTEEAADWAEPLEQRAAELLRRDYERIRTPARDRVIELLAERNRLFWGFRRATAFSNVTVFQPTRLVSRGDIDALDGRLPGSELRAWKEINEELDGEPLRRAFDDLLEGFAAPVDRHEVQHQLDFRRGLVAIPAPLRELLGMPDTMDISPWSAPAQCRDELSAELAAIATAEPSTLSVFTLSQQPLFDRTAWGTPHAVAAAVILGSIAIELGIRVDGPLYAQGQFERRRAKDLFFAITDRHADTVAGAAQTVYAKLFDTVPARLESRPWTVARAWRK